MNDRKKEGEPIHQLTVCLLGSFALERDGITLPRFRTRKEQWLLALLLLKHRQALDREWLAATFWPETREEGALGNLRRCLCNLRAVLGPNASCLTSPTPRTLRLDITNLKVDLFEFDEGILATQGDTLESAIALYRGPLLEGCSEEWVFQERRVREESCIGALERLGAQCSARGEYGEAASLLHRAASMDPLRESVHRALLEVLAAAGDYAVVDRHYRDLRVALRREINAEPAAETASLYRSLKVRGRTPALPAAPQQEAANSRRLPCPLTRLVGRRTQIDEGAALLEQKRLVTLVGSGGIGKTRLAIAIAEAIAGRYQDSVWFVDLSSITDPASVVQAIAAVLGAREQPGCSLEEQLASHIHTRALLLLLDNCEHLLSACRAAAHRLLSACPNLHLLATSRERLNIDGEQVYRVPSLPVPAVSRLPSLEKLRHCEAVQLFVDRAGGAAMGFALTASNAPAIAEICSRLDGIPLALELAAARARGLAVEQIRSRLDDRFQVLTGGSKTSPVRHQTLRALMDWSYDLLGSKEQALFCRLSVFSGGWTLEAAEQICAGENISAHQVLDLLTELVDKSLVTYLPDDTVARYNFLESTRAFAVETQRSHFEFAALQARHGSYFLGIAQEAELHLSGPDQVEWLNALETDSANLLLALRRLLSDVETIGPALKLAVCLSGFWELRGYCTEGRKLLTEASGVAETRVAAVDRASAHDALGRLALKQGDYGAARASFEAAYMLRQQLPDQPGLGGTLSGLGAACVFLCDYESARTYNQASLERERRIGNRSGETDCLTNLGIIAKNQHQFTDAHTLLEAALSIAEDLDNQASVGRILHNMGRLAYEECDYPQAPTYYKRSLEIHQRLGSRAWIATDLYGMASATHVPGCSPEDRASARALWTQALSISRDVGDQSIEAGCLYSLADSARVEGDYKAARSLHEQSLRIRCGIGAKLDIAFSIGLVAVVNGYDGQPLLAARLLGAASALHESMGAPLTHYEMTGTIDFVDTVRAAVGEHAFAKAWSEGRELTMDQAVELALSRTGV